MTRVFVTLIPPAGDVIARGTGTRRVCSLEGGIRVGPECRFKTRQNAARHGEGSKDSRTTCKSNQQLGLLLGGQKREHAEYGHIRFDNTRFIPPSTTFVPHSVTPSRQPPLFRQRSAGCKEGCPGCGPTRPHCTNQGWCRSVQVQPPMRLRLTRLAAFHSIAEA